MQELLRLAGAGRPGPGPLARQLPDDWVPVWSDLGRVRQALDEALVYMTVLTEQVDPAELALRDLRWQIAESARIARAYYLMLVDRLAGATPAESQSTSEHSAPDARPPPETPI